MIIVSVVIIITTSEGEGARAWRKGGQQIQDTWPDASTLELTRRIGDYVRPSQAIFLAITPSASKVCISEPPAFPLLVSDL